MFGLWALCLPPLIYTFFSAKLCQWQGIKGMFSSLNASSLYSYLLLLSYQQKLSIKFVTEFWISFLKCSRFSIYIYIFFLAASVKTSHPKIEPARLVCIWARYKYTLAMYKMYILTPLLCQVSASENQFFHTRHSQPPSKTYLSSCRWGRSYTAASYKERPPRTFYTTSASHTAGHGSPCSRGHV